MHRCLGLSWLLNLLPISSNVSFSDHLGKAVLTAIKWFRSGIGWLCWTLLRGHVCSRYGCPTSKHVLLLSIHVWRKHYLVAITGGCILRKCRVFVYVFVYVKRGEGQTKFLTDQSGGGAISTFTPLEGEVLPNLFLLEAHFPKLNVSNVLSISGHSRESNAFLKSSEIKIPPFFCFGMFHYVINKPYIFSNVSTFYKNCLVCMD